MLTVITGPMFSGKTSKLMSILNSNIIAGNNVAAFKPDVDDRWNITKALCSHTYETFPAATLPAMVPGCVVDVYKEMSIEPDVIGFDEVQFYAKSTMVQIVKLLLNKENKHVICAGLSQDYNNNPFGDMPELLSIADEIISLKAVCSKCKGIGIATRTYRKEKNAEQVIVGGTDKYEARCYTCWKAGNEI